MAMTFIYMYCVRITTVTEEVYSPPPPRHSKTQEATQSVCVRIYKLAHARAQNERERGIKEIQKITPKLLLLFDASRRRMMRERRFPFFLFCFLLCGSVEKREKGTKQKFC